MSVKNEMSYWVICDRCGYREGEDEDYLPLYPSRAEAVTMALEGDWYKVGRYQHACGNCVDWDDEGVARLKQKPVDAVPKDSSV